MIGKEKEISLSEIVRVTNLSIVYRYGHQIIHQISALIFGIIIARILGPEDYGIVAIANMIILYANSFTNFGLNNAIVQQNNINIDQINTIFTLDFLISVFLAITTFLLSSHIAGFFNNSNVINVLKFMSLYYLITAFKYIPIAILRRNLQFKALAIIEVSQSILISCFTVILAINGYDYWSLIFPSISIEFLTTIFLILKTGWTPRLRFAKNMSEIYQFGGWNFIRIQLSLIVGKVDYYVIGKYLNLTMLGFYEKAFELTDRLISGLTSPVNSVFFSTFSKLKANTKHLVYIRSVFLDAASLLATITYPVIFGIVAVAPNFVISCLGDKWETIVIPIQILALACIFRVMLGMIASVNIAIGLYRSHTIINVVTSIIFISLCFFLVQYGINAIAIAYFVHSFVSCLFSLLLFKINTHLSFVKFVKKIMYQIFGSLLMFGVVVLLKSVLLNNVSSILHLVLLIFTGIAIYGPWIFFFYRKGLIAIKINQVL